MSIRKVLIVDDEPMIGELLCHVFELSGFEPRNSLCGEEAIRDALAWRPDAIVLDLMLPDMDGFQVFRSLRNNPITSGTGVLMLTALLSDEVRTRALTEGIDRFMTKPFQPTEVVREIRQLMERGDGRDPPTDGTAPVR